MKIINQYIGYLSDGVIKVLREFGLFGVLVYVGGFISLANLFFNTDFKKQILFGAIGLLLFALSILMAHSRARLQRDRDLALIEGVGISAKILADKVGSNCSNEQVVSITQTIWQMYKDLGIKLGTFDGES